jgi:putative hydrolase of the HAD superfamily
MFDAVLFDLDETLIPDEPVCRHAFHVTALELTGDEGRAQELAEAAARETFALWQELPPLAAEYGLRIGHSSIEGLWATYDRSIPAEAQLEHEMQRMRPEVWRRALATCGLEGDPHKLEQRWQMLRRQFPLFPDTDEVLALLRPHTKLAIVTNGVSGLQRRKLNGSGLLHWFDVVAVSGEVTIGKPNPGIFEWVTQQLGVKAHRCAMVGDNPERDIQGGLNAGMKTAWVDHGLRKQTVKADLEVKKLSDLLPWLRRG